jgi:hypothetical protein
MLALAGEIQQPYPRMPVLLPSGFASKIAAGDPQFFWRRFFAKPYRKAALAAALRRVLDSQLIHRSCLDRQYETAFHPSRTPQPPREMSGNRITGQPARLRKSYFRIERGEP